MGWRAQRKKTSWNYVQPRRVSGSLWAGEPKEKNKLKLCSTHEGFRITVGWRAQKKTSWNYVQPIKTSGSLWAGEPPKKMKVCSTHNIFRITVGWRALKTINWTTWISILCGQQSLFFLMFGQPKTHKQSHEFTWRTMNSHEEPWRTMKNHEVTWIHMNIHEFYIFSVIEFFFLFNIFFLLYHVVF